jgi:hypothetical protein
MTRNRQGKATPGKTLAALALAIAAWYAHSQGWLPEEFGGEAHGSSSPSAVSSPAGSAAADGSDEIARAVAEERSGFMVSVGGAVKKVLPDDEEGSRHQRFIVTLANGDTVLVAHNIDLAPRVPLSEGDRVEVHGQYEWNEQGGVLHWTHHDPDGRHAEGWIRHEGQEYR